MKLSHNYTISQPENLRQLDHFNRKLERQRIGFGLLTPGFSLAPNHQQGIYSGKYPGRHSGRTEQISVDHSVAPINLLRRTGIQAISFALQSWKNLNAKRQERKAIRDLLSKSNHYLDDIGLNRAELQLLLQNHGSLEELVDTKRGEKLTEITRPERINIPEIHVDPWENLDSRFYRAA